jgi:hypothetical protein
MVQEEKPTEDKAIRFTYHEEFPEEFLPMYTLTDEARLVEEITIAGQYVPIPAHTHVIVGAQEPGLVRRHYGDGREEGVIIILADENVMEDIEGLLFLSKIFYRPPKVVSDFISSSNFGNLVSGLYNAFVPNRESLEERYQATFLDYRFACVLRGIMYHYLDIFSVIEMTRFFSLNKMQDISDKLAEDLLKTSRISAVKIADAPASKDILDMPVPKLALPTDPEIISKIISANIDESVETVTSMPISNKRIRTIYDLEQAIFTLFHERIRLAQFAGLLKSK